MMTSGNLASFINTHNIRRHHKIHAGRELRAAVCRAQPSSTDISNRAVDEYSVCTSTSDSESGCVRYEISTARQYVDREEFGEHGAAFLSGNYYPVVQEVTASCSCNERKAVDDNPSMRVVGTIPNDFPLGRYAYVGPNPKFPVEHYKRWGQGPGQHDFGLGVGWHHWFEGDGMIYATDFCAGEKVRYRNRFIRTTSWQRETKHGARIFRPLMNADGPTFLANALANFMQSGTFMKESANTALLHFSGRTYALQDTCPPWELDAETLDTISASTFDGKLPWYVPFTAHPKILPWTGELVFFGFNPVSPPHCTVGTLTPQGEVSSVNPLWSLPFVGSIFMHDFCVTEHFTIIFEGSMDIKPFRQILGIHPLQYNECKRARFGVLNRGARSNDVSWFNCSCAQMVYHFINAWEDKNAKGEQLIVIVGVREDGFFHEAMRPNGSSAWVQQAVRSGDKIPRVHEWKINLVTGEVAEEYLFHVPMETPRINDKFVGMQNRYAYAGRILLSELETSTQLKFDAIVKIDLHERKTKVYEHGPNRYGMEAQFVARPGSEEEDDGWLIMYVHDESNMSADYQGCTQCVILDARNLEAGPVASISLPERVPYGAHCMWRADMIRPGETFKGAAHDTDVVAVDAKINPQNRPKLFAFTDSQKGELLDATARGISRLALGLFVHGWSPRIAFDDVSRYAFVRGAGLRLQELNGLEKARARQSNAEKMSDGLLIPTLELYDIEDDGSCRLVREVLNILDVAYVCKPCSQHLSKYRSELELLRGVPTGSEQIPYLHDTRDERVKKIGPDAIIQYLYNEYLDGEKPSFLVSLVGWFSKASARTNKTSGFTGSSTVLEQPLVFWAYEASPFCAVVRKALYELGLPHVVLPCARGSIRRDALYKRVGAFQVPFLEDPNTGVSLFESSDIVDYLERMYADHEPNR